MCIPGLQKILICTTIQRLQVIAELNQLHLIEGAALFDDT
jgi:hypothetical protein